MGGTGGDVLGRKRPPVSGLALLGDGRRGTAMTCLSVARGLHLAALAAQRDGPSGWNRAGAGIMDEIFAEQAKDDGQADPNRRGWV